MKFETVVDSINFAWDQVVVAFWARYPNPFTSHVLTEDVLRRELRPDGSLYTCRLLMKTNSIPKWGQALMPARRVPIIEESIVDPNKKTLVTYCRNITYKRLMETAEKVVYTSHEDDAGKSFTQCQKKFWVTSQWYAPIGGWSERFGIQRWLKNVDKTRRGLEHVLGQIYDVEDGVEDDSTPTAASSAAAKTGALRHPFIAEKRRMLKEKAAVMGHKAKARLKQPIDQAKEKYMETYERTKENAKVTIGTAQDNLKDKLGGVREEV